MDKDSSQVRLHIGDRVEFIQEVDEDDGVYCGQTGTICGGNIISYDELVGIDWDEEKSVYHNCNGAARKNHGWFVSPLDVMVISDDIRELGEISHEDFVALFSE